MPTLAQTTKATRKMLKWGTLGFIVFIILLGGIRLALSIRERLAPPPPPTVKFGKLPQIKFPQSVESKKINYVIDTLTGALPGLPTQKEVVKISSPKPDLLSLQKTQTKVAKIGFTGDPAPVSENTYKWESQKDSLSQEITVNILSGNFTFDTNFITNPDIASSQDRPSEQEAIETAKNFLNSLSSLPADIDLNKTQTKLLSIDNGILTDTTSLSNTRVIRVDFFQKDVLGSRIFYPTPHSSFIRVYVGKIRNQAQVLKAEFAYYEASNDSSTYPIVTSAQAFKMLQEGNAYIALFPATEGEIKIKNIELGYYLSSENPAYLMPIIVFSGDNFLAYVSAVTDEFVSK